MPEGDRFKPSQSIEVPMDFFQLTNKRRIYLYRNPLMLLSSLVIIPSTILGFVLGFAILLPSFLKFQIFTLGSFLAGLAIGIAIITVIYKKFVFPFKLNKMENSGLMLTRIGFDIKKKLVFKDMKIDTRLDISEAEILFGKIVKELKDSTNGQLKKEICKFRKNLNKLNTVVNNAHESGRDADDIANSLVSMGDKLMENSLPSKFEFNNLTNSISGMKPYKFASIKALGEKFKEQSTLNKFVILLLLSIVATAAVPDDYKMYVFMALLTLISATPVYKIYSESSSS